MSAAEVVPIKEDALLGDLRAALEDWRERAMALYFASYVAPELAWVRRGRLKIVSVAELRRWLEVNGEHLPDAEFAGPQQKSAAYQLVYRQQNREKLTARKRADHRAQQDAVRATRESLASLDPGQVLDRLERERDDVRATETPQ